LNGTIGMLIDCFFFEGCGTISLDLEDFLRAEASCAGCRKPADHVIDDGGCDCRATKRESGFVLLLISEAAYDTYYRLAQASEKGARAIQRYKAVGHIPKSFYQALGAVQSFTCYYCVRELNMGPVNVDSKAHMEHQDPDAASLLGNLVLSCRRCNTQKGQQHANAFAERKGQELTEEEVAWRSEVWRAVKTWRKSPAGKAWAAKLPGKR